MPKPIPPACCAPAIFGGVVAAGCHGTKAGAAETLFRRDTKCTGTYVEKVRQSHARVAGCGEVRYCVCRRSGARLAGRCQEESVYAATHQTIPRSRFGVSRRGDRARGIDILRPTASDRKARVALLAVPAVESHTLQLTMTTAQSIAACGSLDVSVDGAAVPTSEAELDCPRSAS